MSPDSETTPKCLIHVTESFGKGEANKQKILFEEITAQISWKTCMHLQIQEDQCISSRMNTKKTSFKHTSQIAENQR